MALSFFKKLKIDYKFDGGLFIEFPCFHCGNKLTMEAVTTLWVCSECANKGNIITLHQFLENQPGKQKNIQKQKIYNPRREFTEITNKLRRSATKYEDESFLTLLKKIETLIEFHEKKPS